MIHGVETTTEVATEAPEAVSTISDVPTVLLSSIADPRKITQSNPFLKLRPELPIPDDIDPMNKYDDAVDAAAWKDVNYSYGNTVNDGNDTFEMQINALKDQFCREKMNRSVANALANSVGNRIQMASNALASSVSTGVIPEVKARLSEDPFHKLTIPEYESLTSPVQELHYEKTTFISENKTAFHRDPLPQGSAVLTSKRLIFFSEKVLEEKNFQKHTVPGLVDQAYKLKWKEGAHSVYFPIPLSLIRSVEIVSKVEFETDAEFIKKYRFFGLGSLFKVCAPLFCSFWQPTPDPMVTTYQANRSIQLGVRLPPWGEKTIVLIKLPATAKTEDAVEFVSNLQRSTQCLFGINGVEEEQKLWWL
ncbi:uncharacterized protein [Oscarella lobularis]|uniref:uncharacterized protein n=1 Tax=Oscarella lobularis TaxID=121494 RepID=UPI0033139E53